MHDTLGARRRRGGKVPSVEFFPSPRYVRLVIYTCRIITSPLSTSYCHSVVVQIYNYVAVWMLLPRLGLIGSFVCQGAASKRVCPGFRGALSESSYTLLRLRTTRAYNVALTRKMSSTEYKQREEKTHTKVVGGVRELCDRYDGFILDQFGVLHGEWGLLLVKMSNRYVIVNSWTILVPRTPASRQICRCGRS